MIDWKKHITSDKSILLGKPVIKGTRISVEFIIELLASGWSELDILENYPRLKKKDLQAVFAYMHENIRDGLFFEISD